MKGHVSTPDELCEKMVRRLFRDERPTTDERILYPGCGDGPFPAAVERVCDDEGWDYPTGVGVETNPTHLERARDRDVQHVTFREQDFLDDEMLTAGRFNYIIGNPPYVPIEALDEDEKERHRANFQTAVGRFDLYLLFFERALEMLAENGVLSFITPEKFEYVETAEPLRQLLTNEEVHVEAIEHIDADAFTDLITFPCITTIRKTTEGSDTVISLRDGSTHTARLPGGDSWAASVRGIDVDEMQTGVTLKEITKRISPGLATGADKVFVRHRDDLPSEIDDRWVWPTVAGRQLRKFDGPYTDSVFVCPYKETGELADENELGEVITWLEDHRDQLEDRSCVEGGKKWYAWHESPPMADILQPKIVFKDIDNEPTFWAEDRGTVIPKHSVYYAVPKTGVELDELLAYLNSPEATMWMKANCQKAHNGFYRLQSRVLENLPVPKQLTNSYQATL